MKKLICISLTNLIILGLLKFCSGTKKTLPVFMMDNDAVMSRLTIEPNPFKKMCSDLFKEMVQNAIKRTECVVIFIEESLCTEDLAIKDKKGTPFYNLHKGIVDKKVIYIPSVSEPYELLRQIFEPHALNTFHLGSGDKVKVLRHHKYLYIYFKHEPDISRVERFRRHDALMKDVYFTVRQVKAAPILAFYTGKKNPITLAQLKHMPQVNWVPLRERGVMVATKDALFRLTGIFSSMESRRSSFEDTPVVEVEMRTRDTLSTTMLVTDFHLQFNFEFDNDVWKLANVALLEAGEEVGRTSTGISAPWQRSYYCAEPITIFNMRDGSSITISEYQIEPLVAIKSKKQFYERVSPNQTSIKPKGIHKLREGDEEGETEEEPEPPTESVPPDHSFSKALSCGPYFNAVILSGVFVFAIFTVITLSGVVMLFNCPTNDRFDDPNQKPLVIAHEQGY